MIVGAASRDGKDPPEPASEQPGIQANVDHRLARTVERRRVIHGGYDRSLAPSGTATVRRHQLIHGRVDGHAPIST